MSRVNERLQEVVVFMVHGLKRLDYGFHRLDEVSDAADASPQKAFYFDGIYNYVSAFFLLDSEDHPPGGTFHKVLADQDLQNLLDPVRSILDTPLGETTFREVIRLFRNRALIHTSHRDADLEVIYSKVDMEDRAVQEQFQNLLRDLRAACQQLAVALCHSASIDPRELGLT